MRFRATLAPEQVSHLYALIGPLAKVTSSQRGPSSSLSQRHGGGGGTQGSFSGGGGGRNWLRGLQSYQDNTCLLMIDSNNLHLALDNLPQTAGMTCVAALQAKGGIFLDHRIESNAEDNRIVLRVDLQQLRVALQSIQQHIHKSNSGSRTSNQNHTNTLFSTSPTMLTVLKLSKIPSNNMPCLLIEAKTAQRMEIHQMIPVHVQHPEEWKETKLWPDYLPPQPAVQLTLSPATGLTLKALLDTVKQQSLATAAGGGGGGGSRHSTGASVRHILLTGHAATAEMRLSCQQHSNGVHWQTILLGRQVPVAAAVVNDHPMDGENNNNRSTTTAQSADAAAATVCVDASQVACALHHGAWTTQWAWFPNVALVVTVHLEPVGACNYVLPVHYLEEIMEDNDEDD